MNEPRSRLVSALLMVFVVIAVVFVAVDRWRNPLTIRADGERDRERSEFEFESPEPLDPGGWSSAPSPVAAAKRLNVAVTDQAGAVVSDALVYLCSEGKEAPRIYEGTALKAKEKLGATDATGRVALAWEDRAGAGRAVLVVRHPAFRSFVRELAQKPTEELAVVLQPGQEIRGRVVLMDGKTPASGVRIVARGTSAPYGAAQEGYLPGPRAAQQSTRSDEDGRYVLRGLESGWYQLDVAEPGLCVVPRDTLPAGNHIAFVGERAVFALAGGPEAEIRVAAIAYLAVRVVDGDSGHRLPAASVQFAIPAGFRPIYSGPASNNSYVFLSNGRAYCARPSLLEQGTFVQLLVSNSYPIPTGGEGTAHLAHRQYAETRAAVPLRALGVSEGFEFRDVTLQSAERMGGVRLTLTDRDGRRVRHEAKLVWESGPTWEQREVLPAHFGGDGRTCVMARPAGRYRIRVASNPKWVPVQPIEIEVRAGEVTESRLVLQDFGGFDLRVLDSGGRELDDFGVRTALGHNRIEGKMEQRESSLVVTGIPIRVPGLGPRWPAPIMGYPEGPVTIEIERAGYKPRRIHAQARAGYIVPLEIRMEPTAAAQWRLGR